MNRTRQRAIALLSAFAAVAFVGGFVAADLYFWPQLRWPVAVIGASLLGVLVLLGIGAVVFHFVDEMDGHVEAKIEAERCHWRNVLARALRD